MAATNVYVSITRVPDGTATAGDGFGASNVSATQGPFPLKGGTYAIDVVGSTFGTVTLERLGPDGSNYLNALAAFSANGTANATLPPGTYKLVLA